MKLISILLSEIRPYKNNNKKHSPEHIQNLKRSILKFGITQDIGIDRHNVIVFGQGRYYAIIEINKEDPRRFKNLKVKDCSHLTPNECREYRILDNKIVSVDYDDKLIKIEIDKIIKKIPTAEQLTNDIGLSNKDIKKMFPDLLPAEPDDTQEKKSKKVIEKRKIIITCPHCNQDFERGKAAK